HSRSRRPSAPRMSRMEHIVREIWRLVRYVGLGFREFFLLQQVYFASCSVGLADAEDPWEERFRSWRLEVRRSRWFGGTFGRAAHRGGLSAFWKGSATLELQLLVPHPWGWHVEALSYAAQ